jgi:L-lactate dehydrogenase (cytochrome)
MFQLYLCKDREVMRELISRCKRAGYSSLCLTVDVPVIGKRERDLRSGFSMQPRWSLENILSFARHPHWVLGQLRRGKLHLANLPDQARDPRLTQQSRYSAWELDPSVTWKDVREISDQWSGPLALKGVMSADDAKRAADAGATAVIVSNHGGRQLDGAAAPFEVLPQIARAVGDRIEVILDGGIRRGVHVLKALARGAKACSIGRPYLYGLSAGGETGVIKALTILRSELILAMQLSGCPDLASIDASRIGRSQ